jgi:hypothetical protein
MKENQCAKRIHKIHGEKYTKKNALTMKIPAPHGHPFLKFTTPLSSISSDFLQEKKANKPKVTAHKPLWSLVECMGLPCASAFMFSLQLKPHIGA